METYKNGIMPTWCKGCGHFGVLNALDKALVALGNPPERTTVVSGIGCSGRMSGYFATNGIHGINGRSLPIAQGIKLARPEQTVIAAGGDGDGFAIGLGHTLHAMRRNVNVTYLLMNNRVYGLTKGHTSPLSNRDFTTKSTPYGAIDMPLDPVDLALAAEATFVGQGFSGKPKELIEVIRRAIEHPGFSFVNIFSPCVTFNRSQGYPFFNERVDWIEEETDDYALARERYRAHPFFLGVLYQDTDRIVLEGRPEKGEPVLTDLLKAYR